MKKRLVSVVLCGAFCLCSAFADDGSQPPAPDNFPPPTCLPCGSPPLPWGWWFWPYMYIEWWISFYS